MPRKQEVEKVICPKCGCSWLQQVLINQYSTIPASIDGVSAVCELDTGYVVFKCIKCNTLVLPQVDGYQTSSRRFKLYEKMVAEVQGDTK